MASLLLVEDDELIRRMVSLRLKRQGHRVDLAQDGRLEGVVTDSNIRHAILNRVDFQRPIREIMADGLGHEPRQPGGHRVGVRPHHHQADRRRLRAARRRHPGGGLRSDMRGLPVPENEGERLTGRGGAAARVS